MPKKKTTKDGLYMKICPINELLGELKKRHNNKIAAILCTTRKVEKEQLKGCKAIIIPFEDVQEGPYAMKLSQAHRITAFVNEVLEEGIYNRLYVSCDYGQSRSAAVSAAIVEYVGGNSAVVVFRNPKFSPNVHVYKTMCQAMGLRFSNAKMRHLIKENKRAFANFKKRAERSLRK